MLNIWRATKVLKDCSNCLVIAHFRIDTEVVLLQVLWAICSFFLWLNRIPTNLDFPPDTWYTLLQYNKYSIFNAKSNINIPLQNLLMTIHLQKETIDFFCIDYISTFAFLLQGCLCHFACFFLVFCLLPAISNWAHYHTPLFTLVYKSWTT